MAVNLVPTVPMILQPSGLRYEVGVEECFPCCLVVCNSSSQITLMWFKQLPTTHIMDLVWDSVLKVAIGVHKIYTVWLVLLELS